MTLFASAFAFVAAWAMPASAQYYNAYTTTATNIHSGPGVAYPFVALVPTGTTVHLYSCVRGWQWCDIAWDGHRGWIAGAYLQTMWQNRRQPWPIVAPRHPVPVVPFHVGPYWDRYYRPRPWYPLRDRWARWDYENNVWR